MATKHRLERRHLEPSKRPSDTVQHVACLPRTRRRAVSFITERPLDETLRDLQKKPVPKISTRSRRGPAARHQRRPRPPPNHCRSPPLQAPQDLTTRKVFGRPPQERVGNQKNGPDAAPTLTGAPLRLLRRAGASSLPAPAARLETTRRVRLHLEPQKTRPHRRPDVLAPGCGPIMSTETPGNRPGDVAR